MGISPSTAMGAGHEGHAVEGHVGMVMYTSAQPAEDPQIKEVLDALICRCGCNLSVYECENTMTCDIAVRMRADAEKKLAKGMSPPQVLDSFAASYGERVLAAPTKEGFNLIAWILPFVGLAIGSVTVAFVLRAWLRQRGTAEQAPPEVDPNFAAAIEEEVKRGV